MNKHSAVMSVYVFTHTQSSLVKSSQESETTSLNLTGKNAIKIIYQVSKIVTR